MGISKEIAVDKAEFVRDSITGINVVASVSSLIAIALFMYQFLTGINPSNSLPAVYVQSLAKSFFLAFLPVVSVLPAVYRTQERSALSILCVSSLLTGFFVGTAALFRVITVHLLGFKSGTHPGQTAWETAETTLSILTNPDIVVILGAAVLVSISIADGLTGETFLSE